MKPSADLLDVCRPPMKSNENRHRINNIAQREGRVRVPICLEQANDAWMIPCADPVFSKITGFIFPTEY